MEKLKELQNNEKENLNIQTVILAAGKGKRMQSDISKAATLLCEKPLVNYVVELADNFSNKIITVVGYRKEDIFDALENHKDVVFCEQKEQTGTASALMCAKDEINDGTVLVLYGDVPLIQLNTIEKMYKAHKENDNTITFLTAIVDDPFGYGRIISKKENGKDALYIVEQKNCTPEEEKVQEINCGIYLIDGKEFENLLSKVEKNPVTNEYYLTDIVQIAQEKDQNVGRVLVDELWQIQGINTQEQLKLCEQILEEKVKSI